MSHLKYLALLENKFGKEIIAAMTEGSQTIRLRKGPADSLYVKGFEDNNKQKVAQLIPPFADIIEKEMWAFDFPGWIGALDFTAESVKEIMVIGMEPHIGLAKDKDTGNRNFQATYGLRETSDNVFGELEEYKPNIKLWKNLHGIFGDADQAYRSREFLDRFYITDMAHFAVQGKAKALTRVKQWKSIRQEIAEAFLLEEINLIRPRYIVSQSSPVASFVEGLLDRAGKRIAKKATADFRTAFPAKYTHSPTFKKYIYQGKVLVHLRLPHLASGMTNDFWIPALKHQEKRATRLEGLRKELLEFTTTT